MYKKISLAMLLILGLSCSSFAATYYVASGSAGAGTSWSSPYGSLDAALAVAVSGDTVLVAAGKYIPSGTTFTVPAGVTLKGGYSAYWSSYVNITDIREFYNPNNYHTLLSGDTNSDYAEGDLYANPDALDAMASRADNKASIVTMVGDGSIDGLIFYHGGTSFASSNGGAINAVSSGIVTVNNCQFFGCSNQYGAIYNNTGTLTLTNCYFQGNSSNNAVVTVKGIAVITGCTFKGNSNSGEYGNGIRFAGSSLTMNNCLIVDSVSGAVSSFGSLYCRNGIAGAVGNISNCMFKNDRSDGASTYIYDDGYVSQTYSFTNCLWSGNMSHTGNANVQVKVRRVGSGLTANFINCTIADNKDGGANGGLKLVGTAGQLNTDLVCNVKNSILWGNTGAQVRWETSVLTFTDTTYNPFKISYSCIDTIDPNNFPAISGKPFGYTGIPTGLVASDPQFVGNGDYHLQSTSPCIDKGDPTSSYANEPKWLNGCRVNMGAYGNTTEAATTATCVALSADITGDCKVNTADLLALRTQWLKTCP